MTEDVEFRSEGRTLRGWLTRPAGPGPHPGVAMTGGFAAVKEGFLGHPYHEVFAAAGIATLLYDHANCGSSDGEPRQELDPVLQQRGYRDALTFLAGHDLVDAERLGLWGTSYSGGHVLAVAAADRRVRCVVAQCMTISGHANLRRRHPPASLDALRRAWADDRLARAAGAAPAMVPAFGEGSDSVRFADSRPPEQRASWRNEVTVRTWELYDEYEPAAFIERISPTPLLMIVAADDTMTPAEDALAAHERALEPKRLVLVPGGHYAAYVEQFDVTSGAARDWFVEHLG
ncbi:MAG: hydrolase of the alpha/beta superfamily [Actinomycetia bacterium]|nr:hydrolase of the alpha/beta superfamily [Actinomycetes bacterium]